MKLEQGFSSIAGRKNTFHSDELKKFKFDCSLVKLLIKNLFMSITTPLSIILPSLVRIDGSPIPNRDAQSIILKYRDDEGWGLNKTKSVWFSVTELREIIKIIENLSSDTGSGNGTSIYFGKYPSDGELTVPTGNPNYENRQTLVFVPTVPETATDPTTHKDYFDVEGVIASRPPANSYNHGSLNPKPANP